MVKATTFLVECTIMIRLFRILWCPLSDVKNNKLQGFNNLNIALLAWPIHLVFITAVKSDQTVFHKLHCVFIPICSVIFHSFGAVPFHSV